MPKSILGAQTILTSAIDNACSESAAFNKFVSDSVGRFKNKDWGDLPSEDAAMNDAALGYEQDRLFAKYTNTVGGEDIYIITEWDSSVTTILFVSDY